MSLKEIWRDYKWVFVIAGIIVYFVWFREKGPQHLQYDWDLVIGVIIALWQLYEGLIAKAKNESPHIVGLDEQTSLGQNPEPFYVGQTKYWLFRRGGYVSELLFLFSKGNEGILVLPQDLVQKKGNQWVYHAVKRHVRANDLPPWAQNYVERNRIQPPYILGYVPDQDCGYGGMPQYKELSRLVDELQDQLMKKDTVIAEMKEILEHQMNTYHKITDETSNAVHSLERDKSLFDKKPPQPEPKI